MTLKEITKVLKLAIDMQEALRKLRRTDSLREPVSLVQVSATQVLVQVSAWDIAAQCASKGMPATLKPLLKELGEILPLGAVQLANDGMFMLTRQVAR